MRGLLRLYAPPLVMLAWAIVGALSVTGTLWHVLAAVSISCAVGLHITELLRRYGGPHAHS